MTEKLFTGIKSIKTNIISTTGLFINIFQSTYMYNYKLNICSLTDYVYLHTYTISTNMNNPEQKLYSKHKTS